MKIEEQRRLRHLIARFEQTLHSNVEVVSAEAIDNGQRKVIAFLKCWKYAYIFQGDGIVKSWRVTA